MHLRLINFHDLSVRNVQFQWSEVKNIDIKIFLRKIFSGLVFKSVASQRTLEWGFHSILKN
jgi:hypothetical protein